MAATSVEVKLKNVRLSFAHLWEAQKVGNDPNAKPKFNCSFLIPKSDTATIDAVKKAMREVRDAKWGANPPNLKADKLCLRNGDDETYDGYKGCLFVSASNSKRPLIIDRNKNALVEADGKPYSGCFVNGVIRIWAQDNQYGKRINASLEGVQFVREGEAFGAAPLSDDAFEDLGEGEFTDSESSNEEAGELI